MKFRYLIAAAIILPLSAAAEDNPSKQTFKLLDKDNNGMITKMEAAKDEQLTADWSKIDTNNDGSISESELARYHPAKAFTPVEGENEPMGAAPTQ